MLLFILLGLWAIILGYLVLETMYWRRYATLAVDKPIATERVDWHDGCIAQQTSEFNGVAYFLALYRDDSHGCGLLVDHTYSGFIGNDAGDG